MVFCASPFLSKPPETSAFTREDVQIGLALAPLRGYAVGMMVILPFMFLLSVKQLDAMYTRMLLPLLFCVIIEKVTHLRRINDYCRCADAIHSPSRAIRIMHSSGAPGLTPSGFISTFFLLAGKLLVLYLLGTKFFLTGLKSDHQLLFDLGLMLVAIPVFAETGMVLLLTGDSRNRSAQAREGMWPLLVAAVLALPVVVLLVLRGSINEAIVPISLVMFAVFYWKHQADAHLGGPDLRSGAACYESAELAAMLGFLVI